MEKPRSFYNRHACSSIVQKSMQEINRPVLKASPTSQNNSSRLKERCEGRRACFHQKHSYNQNHLMYWKVCHTCLSHFQRIPGVSRRQQTTPCKQQRNTEKR